MCAKCEKPFHGHRHYEKKGLAYCEQHYHQLFGNLCYVCNQVIAGDGKQLHLHSSFIPPSVIKKFNLYHSDYGSKSRLQIEEKRKKNVKKSPQPSGYVCWFFFFSFLIYCLPKSPISRNVHNHSEMYVILDVPQDFLYGTESNLRITIWVCIIGYTYINWTRWHHYLQLPKNINKEHSSVSLNLRIPISVSFLSRYLNSPIRFQCSRRWTRRGASTTSRARYATRRSRPAPSSTSTTRGPPAAAATRSCPPSCAGACAGLIITRWGGINVLLKAILASKPRVSLASRSTYLKVLLLRCKVLFASLFLRLLMP